MNKSEIAERARNMKAVEQSEKLWEKHFSHAETELSKKGMFCYGYEFGYADGERAIAESQAPQQLLMEAAEIITPRQRAHE